MQDDELVEQLFEEAFDQRVDFFGESLSGCFHLAQQGREFFDPAEHGIAEAGQVEPLGVFGEGTGAVLLLDALAQSQEELLVEL